MVQRARCDVNVAWEGAARYKIEPDDHSDQSYNQQNRFYKLLQCVLIPK